MRTDSIETHRRRAFRGVDCGVGLCEPLTCDDPLAFKCGVGLPQSLDPHCSRVDRLGPTQRHRRVRETLRHHRALRAPDRLHPRPRRVQRPLRSHQHPHPRPDKPRLGIHSPDALLGMAMLTRGGHVHHYPTAKPPRTRSGEPGCALYATQMVSIAGLLTMRSRISMLLAATNVSQLSIPVPTHQLWSLGQKKFGVL